MERLLLGDTTIEYTVQGVGEPILLIHGSFIADAFLPLLTEPALAERYMIVNYHRRGFAGSDRAVGPVSMAQQAADARTLLQRVGVEHAHIVGHSYGGPIALQLALDAPDVAHSLALLEPALMMAPSAQAFGEALAPIAASYSAGDGATAVAAFLQVIGGAEYREALDRTLPAGWFARTVADLDTFFQVEFPALGQWTFTADLARRISAPVLAVIGENTPAMVPLFGEGIALLQNWLPRTEVFVLPGANHLLQMVDPRGMAEALASFFARHPLPVPA